MRVTQGHPSARRWKDVTCGAILPPPLTRMQGDSAEKAPRPLSPRPVNSSEDRPHSSLQTHRQLVPRPWSQPGPHQHLSCLDRYEGPSLPPCPLSCLCQSISLAQQISRATLPPRGPRPRPSLLNEDASIVMSGARQDGLISARVVKCPPRRPQPTSVSQHAYGNTSLARGLVGSAPWATFKHTRQCCSLQGPCCTRFPGGLCLMTGSLYLDPFLVYFSLRTLGSKCRGRISRG